MKPAMGSDFVVKPPPRSVRLVRLPVHALDADGLRLRVDGFDQCATDSASAFGGQREQILQVARRFDTRGAAVIKEVRDADERGVRRRDQCEHRLCRVEEALPGRPGDAGRLRGSSLRP